MVALWSERTIMVAAQLDVDSQKHDLWSENMVTPVLYSPEKD